MGNSMKNSMMSLAVATVLSVGFVGCGDSSSDSDNGAVVNDSIVEQSDSNDNLANDSDNSSTATSVGNVYEFEDAPTYPVFVNDGWIDVDGDGEKDTDDVPLEIEMSSYSNAVTVITTLATHSDVRTRDWVIELLSEKAGVSKEEILKIPSKSSEETINMNNTIYTLMQTERSGPDMVYFSDVMALIDGEYKRQKELFEYLDLKNLSTKEAAIQAEIKTMEHLSGGGYVSKFKDYEVEETVKPSTSESHIINGINTKLNVNLYINTSAPTRGDYIKLDKPIRCIHLGFTDFISERNYISGEIDIRYDLYRKDNWETVNAPPVCKEIRNTYTYKEDDNISDTYFENYSGFVLN